jgi:all-trans-retinol 13,14-reductase
MDKNKYDAIIVGGGIAGMTSAVYLAREGQKVLLIEKNNECGGLVNTFSRDGFGFESGVRALEDAGVIFAMLKDLGIELEVVKSYVSVGIADEIVSIKDLSSLEDYQKMLVKIYPDSKDEIEGFIKIVRKIMKHMEVLYGIENPVFKDLKRDRAFLFKKLLPWLPKFIFTVRKINRLNMPVEEFLEQMIKNNSLRDIISQHFFKNTPTFLHSVIFRCI